MLPNDLKQLVANMASQAAPPKKQREDSLLDADYALLAAKVAAGKPLTAAERAAMEARANGSAESTPYARTIVELADLLGVSRRTIANWRRMEGAPRPASNGSHPVAEWRAFIRTRGLKSTDEVVGNVEALKARKLLAEVEEREFRVAVKKGEFVSLAEVERTWSARAAQAVGVMRSKFEQELPPILSGLDATGIQAELARVVDEVVGIIQAVTDADDDPHP
jgi:hypothetical protein